MNSARESKTTPNSVGNFAALRYPASTTYSDEEKAIAKIDLLQQYEGDIVKALVNSIGNVRVSIVMVTLPTNAWPRGEAVVKVEKQVVGIGLTFWLLAPIYPGYYVTATKLNLEGPEDELVALCAHEGEQHFDALRGDRIRFVPGARFYRESVERFDDLRQSKTQNPSSADGDNVPPASAFLALPQELRTEILQRALDELPVIQALHSDSSRSACPLWILSADTKRHPALLMVSKALRLQTLDAARLLASTPDALFLDASSMSSIREAIQQHLCRICQISAKQDLALIIALRSFDDFALDLHNLVPSNCHVYLVAYSPNPGSKKELDHRYGLNCLGVQCFALEPLHRLVSSASGAEYDRLDRCSDFRRWAYSCVRRNHVPSLVAAVLSVDQAGCGAVSELLWMRPTSASLSQREGQALDVLLQRSGSSMAFNVPV
ncbi:hypothetical protein LTS12_014998 [Elasticomyces elasticus]|nr:hypothetical protein LTS12_014998 [Elasticomyces elasticus]